MKFGDYLRDYLPITIGIMATLFIMWLLGLLVLRPLPAADLEPKVEVVQGPESFVTFNAWMQHLNTVNRANVAPTKKKSKPAEKPAQLLDPYFAKKHLRGDAWAAWALKYNERARDVGIDHWTEVIRGTTTHIETYQNSTTITTTPLFTRERYTGGIRTIYNPHCPPRE
jgi:hypothetical protein